MKEIEIEIESQMLIPKGEYFFLFFYFLELFDLMILLINIFYVIINYRLLNNLTQALGSCGVDLSQANISVQFDIRKGTSSGSTSTSFGIKVNKKNHIL